MNDDFSLQFVPLSRDACSCGACFARNTPANGWPGVDIYELRIGRTVIRLCSGCLKELRQVLDNPLPSGENGGESKA